MTVLVCGGAGYIGSHAVALLLERGYGVVVIDNLEKGHREAVWDGAELCVGDLRNQDFVNSVFDGRQIDAVMDFAAYSLVGESVANPLRYYRNNVYGTLNLLEAMNKNQIRRIVFSSTASVYGEPVSIPVTEKDETRPINPYGETKLAVERMLKWSDSAYGLKHVILRYFNVGGAHASGKIGEDHNPEPHLIPSILRSALDDSQPFFINGDDYDTPDGTCIRDYIHITDLVEAHILAVKRLSDGGDSDVFNLGNGSGFSNREILNAAIKITGKNIRSLPAPRRPGDPSKLVASSAKAMKELEWNPTHSDLHEIISSAWEWHKNHPMGYEK